MGYLIILWWVSCVIVPVGYEVMLSCSLSQFLPTGMVLVINQSLEVANCQHWKCSTLPAEETADLPSVVAINQYLYVFIMMAHHY